jgi:hypothetical protein
LLWACLWIFALGSLEFCFGPVLGFLLWAHLGILSLGLSWKFSSGSVLDFCSGPVLGFLLWGLSLEFLLWTLIEIFALGLS